MYLRVVIRIYANAVKVKSAYESEGPLFRRFFPAVSVAQNDKKYLYSPTTGWDANASNRYPQHLSFWYPFIHQGGVRLCESVRTEVSCPTFSSPEAALLLVSTKNRDLWPCPTPEVRDSRTSHYSAHAQSQV